MGADWGLLAAAGSGPFDDWNDKGPVLWAVAAALALAWVGLLGLLTVLTDPRKVRPGPATLEVQGSEPPAVVNLLTTDWDLGHEAIPATLVDLAARGHFEIDLEGDRTFVRQGRRARPGDRLTRYEEMVLFHVGYLARQTPDGRVPGEALTTGPDESARNWWKRFRAAVAEDARARGLSRARWSPRLKALLVAAAVPVALSVSLALSTLSDDPDDEHDAGDKATGVVMGGVFTLLGLSTAVGSLSGERDTAAGREAASRWLGLRELLAEDPLFAEQPPAAVAIWDHLLAHGTALGVAHGVVRALPLGAESDREAWSSVGGRWRVVRVRYPRLFPPGYGQHPATVASLGVVHLVVTVPLLGLALAPAAVPGIEPPAAGTGLADLLDELRSSVDGADLAVTAAARVLAVVAAVAAFRGAWMVLVALADLVTGREIVQGQVLRKRVREKDDDIVTHLAVDDGTHDRLRAWRFRSRVPVHQGDMVRAAVTRRLRHARDLQGLAPVTVAGSSATAGAPPAPTPAALAATIPPAAPASLTTTPATTPATAPPTAPTAPGSPAAPAPATAPAAPAASGSTAAPPRDGDPSSAAGGAPALPDDATVSAATGRTVHRDRSAPPHPAALHGGSAIYRCGASEHIQVVWVPAATIDAFRQLPDGERHPVDGLGDEAYRAAYGGGVVARAGARVAMVTPHLPDTDPHLRDELAVRVAAAALAAATAPGPGDHRDGDRPGRADQPAAAVDG